MPSYSFGAISSWQEAVLVAGANVLSGFFSFLPSLFGALILFLFGLILAKWAKALTVKIFSKHSIERRLCKKAG